MSAQIFRIQNNEAEVKVNVFNEYVNPGRDAVWNEKACAASHGLSRGHEMQTLLIWFGSHSRSA